MAKGEFSVYQFFPDVKEPNDLYEEVLRFVDAETAMHQAVRLIMSVDGQLGTTRRVIVTDGGDCVAFEWLHGKGVVFPPRDETK